MSEGSEMGMYHKFQGIISRTFGGSKRSVSKKKKKNEKGNKRKTS